MLSKIRDLFRKPQTHHGLAILCAIGAQAYPPAAPILLGVAAVLGGTGVVVAP